MRTLLPAPRRNSPPREERVTKTDLGGIPTKISSACLACKERKTKCSGTQPCSKCIAKRSQCIFDIASDARRKINRSRSSEISTRQRNLLVRLLETLRHGKQDQIDQLVQLCRGDTSWDQLVAELGSVQDQLEISPFLRSQSSQNWVERPLFDANSRLGSEESISTALRRDIASVMSVGRLADTPLFQLSSGHRWTTVTNDEELISHLISLYFVWEHQTLPFLDRELFIEDFESGQGSFCSPFLVNAILALGSRFSTRPEVAPSAGEHGFRGQTFEAEAYRLWQLENHRATLPTVQALCMLGWRAGADGRDRQGRTLLTEALSLSHDLRLHLKPARPYDGYHNLSPAQQRLQRGRNMTAWAIVNWSVINTAAVMRPLLIKRTSADRTFPEHDFYKGKDWWQPYPSSSRDPRATHFWRIFRHFCEIAEIAQEAMSRLYVEPSGSSDESETPKIPLPEIEDYHRRFDALHGALVCDIESSESDPDLPHYYQARAWSAMYPLILYNTLTDESERRATHERVMTIASQIYTFIAAYKRSYSLRYAQGIIMHPLVVVSYTLISRLDDPRSQPLIEQCMCDMIEMLGHLNVLKAVVHIYALAARRANLQWSIASGLEAALAKITPDEGHCADYPVLGSNSDLVKSEEGYKHNAGLTELLDQWKDLTLEDSEAGTPQAAMGGAGNAPWQPSGNAYPYGAHLNGSSSR